MSAIFELNANEQKLYEKISTALKEYYVGDLDDLTLSLLCQAVSDYEYLQTQYSKLKNGEKISYTPAQITGMVSSARKSIVTLIKEMGLSPRSRKSTGMSSETSEESTLQKILKGDE